ncbi:MAG: hypothetical protein QNJ70_20160 [Xenococcaceae cyanobacterium MO_207.B15]|nr:hypothetical protein [Xenococcaceae cyanobacterium MO_207.B15]
MINPGSSADTGKIQRDEEEILKEIIDKVKKFIEYTTNSLAQNIGKKTSKKKLSNRLSIILNGRTVLQSNMNQQEKIGSVSPEDIKKISQAIKYPQNSPDEIKIKLGKQTLFHVDKQKVVVDKLKLSPAPKQEQNLSLEQKLEQLGKTVEQLGKTVEQQQNKIEQLERKLESKLNFIAMNNTKLKNQKLGNWISNFGSKLYQAWNNVSSTIKNFIDSRVQKATEKVAAVSAGFLEKSVNLVLDKYGREEKPGILSFEGNRFSYSKNIDSGEISITSNSTQNNIVEKGNFTAKASPEDIKILKELPEKVKSSIAQNQTQTQKIDRGISR